MKRNHAATPPRRPGLTRWVTVLLAEQSPVRRRLLAGYLRNVSRLRVAGSVSSLAEGIARCRRLHPDVVVSDLHLPGGSGLELARRIKALHYVKRVIIVSLVGGEIRAVCLRSGADGFVLFSRAERQLALQIRRLFPLKPAINPRSTS